MTAEKGRGEEVLLAKGLQAGERDAWGRLCALYADPLYLYAYHLTGGDRFAAEDLRQETLLAAAEGIGAYRGQAPLFAWLCGILRHKAIDLRRRAGRLSPLPAGAEISDPTYPPPEEVAEERECRARMVEILWSLPAEYRTALIFRYVEELPVAAVAERLNRSYKAAESLLARAREALRKGLLEVERDEKDG